MIRIDITGFYYETDIAFDDTIVTVEDAMRRAAETKAPNGGQLKVSSDLNGFVNEIAVVYDAASRPQSRQGGGPRPTGTYAFNDDPLSGSNVIPGNGGIDGQLAWQYYVTRGGVAVNMDRTIIPYDKSNTGDVGPLQDGDEIRWRLISIFGLRDSIQQNYNMLNDLIADTDGGLSMKSAIRAMKTSKAVDLS